MLKKLPRKPGSSFFQEVSSGSAVLDKWHSISIWDYLHTTPVCVASLRQEKATHMSCIFMSVLYLLLSRYNNFVNQVVFVLFLFLPFIRSRNACITWVLTFAFLLFWCIRYSRDWYRLQKEIAIAFLFIQRGYQINLQHFIWDRVFNKSEHIFFIHNFSRGIYCPIRSVFPPSPSCSNFF